MSTAQPPNRPLTVANCGPAILRGKREKMEGKGKNGDGGKRKGKGKGEGGKGEKNENIYIFPEPRAIHDRPLT